MFGSGNLTVPIFLAKNPDHKLFFFNQTIFLDISCDPTNPWSEILPESWSVLNSLRASQTSNWCNLFDSNLNTKTNNIDLEIHETYLYAFLTRD